MVDLSTFTDALQHEWVKKVIKTEPSSILAFFLWGFIIGYFVLTYHYYVVGTSAKRSTDWGRTPTLERIFIATFIGSGTLLVSLFRRKP